jgi:MATE family multidrug resistance protein
MAIHATIRLMPTVSSDQTLLDREYGHRAIWRIAVPMILSAISTPLVGLVDTGLMGHMEHPGYLGGVAAGANIFSVLFMSLNFLRMGTTGIAAQAFGANNRNYIFTSLAQPLLIALAFALLLLIIQIPTIQLATWLLGLSSEIAQLTNQYFSIRIWSAPAALANFVIIGWLLGMQNARGPLFIVLTINITNLALDLLLVLGLDMGIRGVATATVIAELAGLMVGLVFVLANLRQYAPDWKIAGIFDSYTYRRLLGINSNLFIRSLALMFTFAFITAQGARMGDVVLAANALLLNFQFFLSYALDGIAHAAEALTGKAVGSKRRAGLRLAVKHTLFWSLVLAALFSLTYWLGGSSIIDALTNLQEVRTTAYAYLPWIVILPLLSAGSFLYDGVFVGATRSREMRIVMSLSMLCVFLPVWYFSKDLGNHGLWLAFVMFMAIRSLAMHCWYKHLHNTNKLMP